MDIVYLLTINDNVMKDKTKIILSLIAVGAAGILIGIVVSNPGLRRRLMQNLINAGRHLNLNLLNIIGESTDAFSDMRLKLTDKMD
jgi:hypothetical protein